MRRLALIALGVWTVGGSAPASALDVPVRDPSGSPAVEGPVVAGDGTIVVGVASTRDHFNVLTISSGLNGFRTLASFRRPPKDFRLTLGLTPTDRGVLVTEDIADSSFHCCNFRRAEASVTWFPELDWPGQVVRSCTCSASGWQPPLYATTSDGRYAYIVNGEGDGAHASASVRDLATGAETPARLVTTNYPGPGNTGPEIAGSYLTDPSEGLVVNWETGEEVRRLARFDTNGLLADGTVVYARNGSDQVWRWGAGDAEPTAYSTEGRLEAVAHGRLLVSTDTGYEIWALDGTVITRLGSSFPGSYTFDGTRVVTVQPSCMTVRIHIYGSGHSATPPLDDLCATPVVVAAALGRHGATVSVACPVRYPQGCIGKVRLLKPFPPHTKSRRVAMHPGETATVRLAHWRRPSICRATRRVKRWNFTVGTPAAGYTSQTPFQVRRRAQCKAHQAGRRPARAVRW